MGIEANSVSASKQVQKRNYIGVFENGGSVRVLFVGNSITRHEPKSEIGWENDWGMAASKRENDYVHVVVRMLEARFGKVDYCVANCGEWELRYYDDELLSCWAKARDFHADIVVIRIGENLLQAKERFATIPIAPHYAKMVEYFCSNPEARLVITDLFWRNEQIEDAIRSVAQEKGCALVHLSDLGDCKENMVVGQFWHAGVSIHPNDNGMRKIAERIVAAMS